MAAKKTEKNAMSIINEHINNNSFAGVYLLYGDETYLVNQYRDKLLSAATDIKDNMNFAKFGGEKTDYLEIVEFCETMPFFADRRVVLAENTGFFKKDSGDFVERIKDFPETSMLVFVEKEVDKRNRLYKAVNKDGEALCFETPDRGTLAVWTKSLIRKHDKAISDEAVYMIIDYAGADMYAIKNETDKLVNFCEERPEVTVWDIEQICVGGAENHIFEMVEAIAKKNQGRAIHLYYELLENREPALRILALILRQYDLLLKTKLCIAENKNNADAAALLGVPIWSVSKYKEQSKNYTEKELTDIMRKCQDTDYKLKTSQISDVVAVEVLIVSLSK